jgi:hypothetical protein
VNISKYKRILRELIDEHGGGSLKSTGSGHLEIRLTIGGGPIYTAATPSDKRALLNIRAMVRRVHRLQARK